MIKFEETIRTSTLTLIAQVVERARLPFDGWQFDGSDPDALRVYRAETRRLRELTGNPRAEFSIPSRLYLDGARGDLLAASPPGRDNDEAGEAQALQAVLDAAAPVLASRGLRVPTLAGDYLRSRYAGCLVCPCTGGWIAPRPLRVDDGLTADVHLTVGAVHSGRTPAGEASWD
ncbi:hypothetical protein AB0395_22195 [Streptosporangium sp. NPDC051023]|uniref:hypothetical protein n=1 Tax=Streptosporangium sp. NPDC051023 TaxID=3155410 RepID=UPI00344D538D